MDEAILVSELGWPPEVLNKLGENLIQKMMIYRGVKNVAEFGGNWQP